MVGDLNGCILRVQWGRGLRRDLFFASIASPGGNWCNWLRLTLADEIWSHAKARYQRTLN